MPSFIISIAILITLAVVVWCFRKPIRSRWRSQQERTAIDQFRLRREQLEAKFFDLASGLGKPRGLTWTQCDWQPDVCYAWDKQTGLLTAFVGANISFEAIPGGDMEDVEAVSTIRDAAAVFHYREGNWGTGGKALFNMNPQDAIVRLEEQFEPVQSIGS